MQQHHTNICLSDDASGGLRRFSSAEFVACCWSDLLSSPCADGKPAWPKAPAFFTSDDAATAITASTSMCSGMSQEAPTFMRRDVRGGHASCLHCVHGLGVQTDLNDSCQATWSPRFCMLCATVTTILKNVYLLLACMSRAAMGTDSA